MVVSGIKAQLLSRGTVNLSGHDSGECHTMTALVDHRRPRGHQRSSQQRQPLAKKEVWSNRAPFGALDPLAPFAILPGPVLSRQQATEPASLLRQYPDLDILADGRLAAEGAASPAGQTDAPA
jgi:hypothetical protein